MMEEPPSLVYNFFDKKFSVNAVRIQIMLNQEFAENLHKLIIRKFEKRKLYSSFKDNALGHWSSRYAISK